MPLGSVQQFIISNSKIPLAILLLISAVLAGLKAFEVLSISWYLVFAPVWVPVAAVLALQFVVITIATVLSIVQAYRNP